jgi:hypothetical protein
MEMGVVLSQYRATAVIAEVVMETLRRARQRDDFVKPLAEEWVGPYEPLISGAAAEKAAADEAEGQAFADLLYKLERSMTTFGQVKDDVFNALGRARNDPTMLMLFPNGMGTVREVPPRRAALAMGVIAGQLRKVQNPLLHEARLAGWADHLDASKAEVSAAVATLDTASAMAAHATSSYVRVVRLAWHALPALKRVLKAKGLTEAKVHTVIPSFAAPPRDDAAGANGHDADAPGLAPGANGGTPTSG